jgi:hypothetical protein
MYMFNLKFRCEIFFNFNAGTEASQGTPSILCTYHRHSHLSACSGCGWEPALIAAFAPFFVTGKPPHLRMPALDALVEWLQRSE